MPTTFMLSCGTFRPSDMRGPGFDPYTKSHRFTIAGEFRPEGGDARHVEWPIVISDADVRRLDGKRLKAGDQEWFDQIIARKLDVAARAYVAEQRILVPVYVTIDTPEPRIMGAG